MRLFLIRHGDAFSAVDNPQRPLSLRGQTETRSIALQLNQPHFQPQSIYHSGKLRAKQTAEIIRDTCQLDAPLEELSCLLPESDPQDTLTHLESMQGDILAVSHLPLLDYLLSMMIQDMTQPTIEFHTATTVCLHQQENHSWRIEWVMRP